jgi:protein-tyrosine phosphatase
MTITTVPGTYNFRDLGGLPTATGTTRHGRLLRSDALISLGDEGLAALTDLGVRTAIDLREDKERWFDPPTVADGITIYHQPIFANRFHLDDHAGLPEIYAGILDHCGDNLASAVRLLVDGLPAVIFCSAGKDRTGLTSALVLSAMGVPDDVVADEYARTERVMHGEFRQALIARSVKAGYSEQALAVKLGSPASLMLATLEDLRARFGGAAPYLLEHGLTETELETLRDQLIEYSA